VKGLGFGANQTLMGGVQGAPVVELDRLHAFRAEIDAVDVEEQQGGQAFEAHRALHCLLPVHLPIELDGQTLVVKL